MFYAKDLFVACSKSSISAKYRSVPRASAYFRLPIEECRYFPVITVGCSQQALIGASHVRDSLFTLKDASLPLIAEGSRQIPHQCRQHPLIAAEDRRMPPTSAHCRIARALPLVPAQKRPLPLIAERSR